MGTRIMPQPLSPVCKGSFAHMSMTKRIPVILGKVKDSIERRKSAIVEKYGENAADDVEDIACKISKLLNEIMNNQEFVPITDNREDTPIWNQVLEEEIQKNGGKPIRWHETTWLYLECYMYRRLQEAVELCPILNHLDLFQEEKRSTFMSTQQAIVTLMTHLQNVSNRLNENMTETELKSQFMQFFKMDLWGNRCDLSNSCGKEVMMANPLDQISTFEPNILVNNLDGVWKVLIKNKREGNPGRVDIILDNAGYELIADFCLAEFLLATGLASTVFLHPKLFGWFVSDVTQDDLNWTLDMLCSANNKVMSSYGNKWKGRLNDKSWIIRDHMFWTLHFAYHDMEVRAPDLYRELKHSDALLFKGDLNYRKLVGDLQWEHTTPFATALQGFFPAPLLTLRTLKCDVVSDLRSGLSEDIESKDKNWLVNGYWAVMSYNENGNVQS